MAKHSDNWADAASLNKLVNDTERSLVISTVSMVETLLEEFLVGSMQRASKRGDADDLFGSKGNAPLGTFSAKIKIARRLGLIDSTFAKTLDLLREMRNRFAHSPVGITLADSPLREFLRDLVAKVTTADPRLARRLQERESTKGKRVWYRYLMMATRVISELESMAKQAIPISVKCNSLNAS